MSRWMRPHNEESKKKQKKQKKIDSNKKKKKVGANENKTRLVTIIIFYKNVTLKMVYDFTNPRGGKL